MMRKMEIEVTEEKVVARSEFGKVTFNVAAIGGLDKTMDRLKEHVLGIAEASRGLDELCEPYKESER